MRFLEAITQSVACDSQDKFDPAGTVATHSALTGVIAGVLFTGIVLLVGSRGTKVNEEYRSAALQIMAPAFFTMLVSSFMFSVAGGEGVCQRLSMEWVVAGSLFAVAAAGTFQAIAWMLCSFEGSNQQLVDVAVLCRLMAGGIVLAQMYLTVVNFYSLYPGSASLAVFGNSFLLAGAVVLILTSIQAFTAKSSRLAFTRSNAIAMVGFLVVALVVYDISVNAREGRWIDRTAAPTEALVGLPILLAGCLICISLSMFAGPNRRTNHVASNGASQHEVEIGLVRTGGPAQPQAETVADHAQEDSSGE